MFTVPQHSRQGTSIDGQYTHKYMNGIKDTWWVSKEWLYSSITRAKDLNFVYSSRMNVLMSRCYESS